MHVIPHPTPRHRLTDVPARMAGNDQSTLGYYDASGEWVVRTHRAIRTDVLAVLSTLERQGINLAPGVACAVMGTSGYDWLLASLACLFTGARVVAVPETLTIEAGREVLSNIRIDVALADDRFADVFDCPRTTLEGISQRATGTYDKPLSPGFEHVAFTSGSTSGTRLKAFVIEEEGTIAFIQAFLDAFGITSDDTWVVCHTFSHVVHLEYVLGSLAWGYHVALVDPIQLVIRPEEIEPAVLVTVPAVYEQIAAQMRRRLPEEGPEAELVERIVSWQLTPETRRLAAALAPIVMPEARAVLGTRMKVAIIGAAPSGVELRRFLTLCGVPLYEGYGMSEVGMIACNTPAASRLGSVGRAFPGIGMAVSDEGILTARTSFKRTSRYENVPEEETREVFRDGVIHTGDIARIDEDGFLFITGRAKNLVITDRGKNINPAPIEALLSDISGVGQALVFGDQRPYLVALLAPAPGRTLARQDIHAAIHTINTRLPKHEQVVDFVISEPLTVEAGLLTRSGKPIRGAVWSRYRSLLEQVYD